MKELVKIFERKQAVNEAMDTVIVDSVNNDVIQNIRDGQFIINKDDNKLLIKKDGILNKLIIENNIIKLGEV